MEWCSCIQRGVGDRTALDGCYQSPPAISERALSWGQRVGVGHEMGSAVACVCITPRLNSSILRHMTQDIHIQAKCEHRDTVTPAKEEDALSPCNSNPCLSPRQVYTRIYLSGKRVYRKSSINVLSYLRWMGSSASRSLL